MPPAVIRDTTNDRSVALKKQSITTQDHRFLVHGFPFLFDVPTNIVLAPYSTVHAQPPIDHGQFVGFNAGSPESRHVVSLGKLDGIRFMSIFRFKVWWTTHWIGDKGGDLEYETQIMILNRSDSGRPYVLPLPLIEGLFRASLQPGESDNVDLCVESGSTQVQESRFGSCLYLLDGDDPHNLVKDGMKAVRYHLGTFKLLEEKTPPRIVDKFGWCTWDAFYLNVHPQGVWEGVKGLAEGGCPPGLVLIDYGWQSICHDDDPITDQERMNRTSAGEQMPCRLIKFQENYKFRDYCHRTERPFLCRNGGFHQGAEEHV